VPLNTTICVWCQLLELYKTKIFLICHLERGEGWLEFLNMEYFEGGSLYICVNTVFCSDTLQEGFLTFIRGMLLHCCNSTCIQPSWLQNILNYNTITSHCHCISGPKIPYFHMRKFNNQHSYFLYSVWSLF
jgi:hypothetical protein